ncbi:hypothetical protein Sste5346_004898 [Sporothrix stenoceras]|uniref:Uncharacterized protein n=1 Tax=Sporothrix stenoceras TaxID=5173 RepID=A0ABR3Z6B5_9PEZI
MATTERRKSISLFFGFSKQEPKTDSMPDNFPKLRRKLQKVTKLSDTDMNSNSNTSPAPDMGGVQTVKLPGDETFLATKYDASQPPPSRDGSSRPALAAVTKPAPAKEEKQVRRESRARSFFRSASTSRVPNTTRSSSSTRAATATPTTATGSAIRPGSSRGEPAKPAVATAITSAIPIAPAKTTATSISSGRNNFMLHGNTSRHSSYGTVVIDAESRAAAELQALGDAQDAARAQKKASQAAAQARAFQMMEEHERISAQERSSRNHTQKSTPPSASRTKRMTMLPLTLGAQSAGTTEKPAARPYPMFHRPYSHSQHQNIISLNEADVRRTMSTANKRSQSPYTSRKSMHSAGLTPVTVPSMPMTISPLSPIPSSAMSDSSSASMSSPTSAAFNLSSASLALTAATSVTQSYNNLPLSANGSASSCAESSPDGSVVGSFPYALGRRRNRSKFDFDNESTDSGSGSDSRRVVPELSYLSGGSSRGSPPTPDSPSSISSVEATTTTIKPRRKVKTPVYAIGQLESADETSTTTATLVEAATKQVELSLLQSKSSIECIAEEYRALLASRNSQSTADGKSEVGVDAIQRPISSSSGLRSRNSLRRSVGANSLQTHAAAIVLQRKFMLASPGRDDSPLLPAAIFKEWIPRDIINSPAPPPPLPPLHTRSSVMGINHNITNNNFSDVAAANSSIYEKMRTPPPPEAEPQPDPAQTDNLSLQICVDLLTRELSSAVLHRSSPAAATAASQRAATRRQLQQQNGANSTYSTAITSPLSPLAPSPPTTDNTSSALQILVMIEAYERLRDQLVADAQKKAKTTTSKRHTKSTSGGGEAAEIEAMFGLWLKSLYRIHEQLTSEEKHGREDNDYDDDNDELDNTSDSDYDSAAESI